MSANHPEDGPRCNVRYLWMLLVAVLGLMVGWGAYLTVASNSATAAVGISVAERAKQYEHIIYRLDRIEKMIDRMDGRVDGDSASRPVVKGG